MKTSILSVAASFVGWSAALAATPQQSFPLDVQSPDPALGGLVYAGVPDRISALAELDVARFAGVALPGGRRVDIDLVRIRPERMGFRFFVDGAAAGDLLAGLDLSIWKGHVRGEEASEVMLSFSQVGSQGWIDSAGELVHVMPRPNADGNWWRGDVVFATEAALESLGMRLDSPCATERPIRERVQLPPLRPGDGGTPRLGPGCSLRECKISLSSDYQYFQKFNDLAAETAYTTTLWSYVSDRYETQASTILTFPYVAFYTTSNDPWVAQDTGGDCIDVLYEFQAAWAGSVPNGGRLGHLMSGANLGCGVAWLDVLCDNTYNFSVSGNLNGTIPFPITAGPNNWDFIVCAHEVGHNFNALHTHDYCPPLDQCAPSGYFGACQTQQVCTNQGTIMSYCHLCSGGTANITTYFHTTSAQDMALASQSCLPLYSGLTGSAPTLLAPDVGTPVSASVAGTPVGPVQLYWRVNASQAYAAIDMASQGGGNYSATLPAIGCSEAPEFYYAFTEQTCGAITFPSGAPANVLTAEVGTLQTVFQDNFQTDMGWTPANLGATSGDWQRGVPVNDPGWAYDPAADGDGSGSCWLTQNQLGNTDVDNGAVRLMSPQLDLSGSAVIVEYLYYQRLTNSDGADALVVEISANGTGGPWVEIARHDDDNGSAWTAHSISGSTIAAAGVTLGSNMRMRFTTNDGGTQSIVESGLDGFEVSRVVCSGIGVSYCTSTVNSTGFAAVASAMGSNGIASNDLVLRASPIPPSANGIFFYGTTATQVPFGNGIRCVAAPLTRLPLETASPAGDLDVAVDYGAEPSLTAGSTWNFQAWFRDAAAGGSFYNLSDGYRITFTP